MLKKNRGSSIIEITMMMPFILGCIYFYIISMLFLAEHGKLADELSLYLYSDQCEADSDNSIDEGKITVTKKQDNIESIGYEDVFEKYNIKFELKKCADNPVKNLRRWQFIADTIH